MTFNAFNSMGIIANGTLGSNLLGGPLSGLQTGVPAGGVIPSNPGGTPILPAQFGLLAPPAQVTIQCASCNLNLPTFKATS